MTDKEIELLLREDSEKGMEQIVEQYTGLLWSVADQILQEPEDIKDCVNETFTEFFYQRARFDPEKGALKNYLAVIVRRLAIKKKQENQRCAGAPAEILEDTDAFSQVEEREALDACLRMLDPVDEQIIRMKYYGGMTFKEIAASLDIPYETAKKRHQRSLKKLKKSIIIGLVVALLVALLAACAYVVLRYFGVVPGYGVSTDPETGIYILEEPAVLETEDCTLTITDGWWNNGLLILQYSVGTSAEPADGIGNLVNGLGLWDFTLEGLDNFSFLGDSIHYVDNQQDGGEWYARGGLPEGAGEILELRLMGAASPIPLTLRRAETEVSFDRAGYYDLTEDQGGLLAIPRLENGELIVSIYPLKEGDFAIDAGLTKLCGELAPVTVTAGDGTVRTGSPIGWRPFSSETYFDWNFGPAEPGTYTLTVPYVYESLSAYDTGTGFGLSTEERIHFSLQVPDMEETTVEFPYGSVTMQQMEPTEPYDLYPDRTTTVAVALGEICDRFSWWTVDAEWTCTAPDRTLVNVFVTGNSNAVPVIEVTIEGENVGISPFYLELQTQEVADPETGWTYQTPGDLLVGCNEGINEVYAFIPPGNMYYRWDHEFVISFSVSETE